MGSRFMGMRRRLSLPVVVGSFAIACITGTGVAGAEEVVIGLPGTPPADTFDFTNPEPTDPTPPVLPGPDDITDGDGGTDPLPDGPDDITDGDGGTDPLPDGPDDFTDGDGGTDPTPEVPDDFTDGDGGDDPTPEVPDDFTDGDGGDDPTPEVPDDFTDGDGGSDPVPGPDDFVDGDGGNDVVPAPGDGHEAGTETGESTGVSSVAALPVTGAGSALGGDHSDLAPFFGLAAAGCLLATGLLHRQAGGGHRSHAR